MKKWIALFLLLPLLCFLVPAKKEKPGYYGHFTSKDGFYAKRFAAKRKAPCPSWMNEQIDADFAPLQDKKISLLALDKTEEKARQASSSIIRFRIADNRLYRLVQEKEPEGPAWNYQRAFLTLCRLVRIPDVDLIINTEDGTATPFYLTEEQAPLFGWAKVKTVPYLILIPDYRSVSTWWFDDIHKLVKGKNFAGERLLWAKREAKAFWRGGETEHNQRVKIARLSQIFPDLLDAGLTHITQSLTEYWKPMASYEEHMRYKYLPVLDGVMCTYPGYQWRLLSDSLILKPESDQIQWFYRGLMPYVHYLPVAADLSDLIEQIEWARENDDECEQIACQARQFALENLLFDDVYLYLFLVLSRYSCQLDETALAAIRETPENPAWKEVIPKIDI